jgi:hypothetical protein
MESQILESDAGTARVMDGFPKTKNTIPTAIPACQQRGRREERDSMPDLHIRDIDEAIFRALKVKAAREG